MHSSGSLFGNQCRRGALASGRRSALWSLSSHHRVHGWALLLLMVWWAPGFVAGLSAQPFLISEFAAANYSGIRDADGERSDWIEIYNAGVEPASLAGWSLSNDSSFPTQWKFPEVIVPGMGFLVVFASGKDRTVPGGELHTNFQLNRDGEFLALIRPDGITPASQFAPVFPRQLSDVSYGVQMATTRKVYVAPNAAVRWAVPQDGLLGLSWTLPGFEDQSWTLGTLALGYEVVEAATNTPSLPNIPVPDITQPTDLIVATSLNSPGGEGVGNVIDGNPATKYLNFDKLNAGFTVTPAAGRSIVTGLRFTSANDAPERDPTRFALSGSNDGLTFTPVAEGAIPDFTARFFTVQVAVTGAPPYRVYRLLFPAVRNAATAVAMQIAEIELLGLTGGGATNALERDVTAPGDVIDATSANSPAAEGVANAIDNNPATKYLNFDTQSAGLTVSPATGESVVTGLRLTSANDAPERDPASYLLSGSNDGLNFTPIAQGALPDFPGRFATVVARFTNNLSYRHYRLLFPTVRNATAAVAMQIAEVEFLGTVGPALPTFPELIGTDLKGAMFRLRSSAYVRIPFAVGPSDPLEALALQVRYEDGFVAYLNGTEVARGNASAAPAYDSVALSDRPRASALRWERFSLAAQAGLVHAGENVLAIQALNDRADSPEFLLQAQLDNARVELGQNGYFDSPTPGFTNAAVQLGLVTEPLADRAHGLYDAPFSVALSTLTPEAVIRYTTNGSAPTLSSGILYTGPVGIGRTTVLRAAAFRPGWRPSRVTTSTYLFLEDVITQTQAASVASGFPASWNGQAADYGFDPRVVGPPGQDSFGGKYAREIRQSLRTLPSMSIVLPMEDMFGAQGIYANPQSRGDAWERAASVELIQPDQAGGFQQDAGLRIQGGAFRRFDLTLKKSFRVIFSEQYGATKLKYPLFGPGAAAEFDNFILRANSNDAWPYGGGGALYIRDAFADATRRAMGGVASHSTFVHLYVNGLYWGLYNPVERPDAAFSSSYFGGQRETWDAINQDSAPDGNYDAWNRLLALLGQGASNNVVYQRAQGNNPDGSRNPAYENLIDVVNLIDYMILNFYVGNNDWPDRNYWAGRDRNNGEGFKFYPWDTETSLGMGSGLTTDRTGVSTSVARPYAALRANADFRMRFADRVYRHFFNGGALQVNPLAPAWDPAHPENNRPAARLAGLAAVIDSAMVGESGRWGDQRNAVPYTRDEHWRAARDGLLANYFPQRSATVLQQFRSAGLYPRIDPPLFNQQGGLVATGFSVTLSAGRGVIVYTTDGTDPRSRLQTNGVTRDPLSGTPPGTFVYTGPVVLQDLTTIKARLLDGAEWSALNEAVFVVGTPRLAFTELNYHPYNRTPAEVAAGFLNDDDFEFVELFNAGTVTYDLNGVHFADGIMFDFTGSAVPRLGAGQCVVVVKNRAAFELRYGSGRRMAGVYTGNLSNSGERVAVADAAGAILLEVTYGTAPPWPATPDGTGPTLELRDVAGSSSAVGNWQASETRGGSPGTFAPVRPVLITGVSRQDTTLRLTFEAQAGKSYAVYCLDRLEGGTWQECQALGLSASGGPTEVQLEFTNAVATRFFRIATTDSR